MGAPTYLCVLDLFDFILKGLEHVDSCAVMFDGDVCHMNAYLPQIRLFF